MPEASVVEVEGREEDLFVPEDNVNGAFTTIRTG